MKSVVMWLTVALVTLSAAPLWAQCAVCGNPAFSAGDNDIGRAFGDGAPRQLRLTAGLVYSFLPMSDLYEESTLQKPDIKTGILGTRDWALNLHLITVMMGAEFSSGTALQAVLPMGQAISTVPDYDGLSGVSDADGTMIKDLSDFGVSDLEVRARQRLGTLLPKMPAWMPQVVVSAGFAAPTGVFNVTGASGAVTDQYVSLGRGIWWALFDLDIFGQINDRIGWSWTNGARLPASEFTRESDGYRFIWGQELRSTLSANFVIVPGVLNAALAGEVQWRAQGLADDSDTSDELLPYDNTGGLWVGLNPTVQGIIGGGFSVTATVRIPVYRDVVGIQPVPGLGGVLALNWAWDKGSATKASKPAAPKPAIVPGERPSEPLIQGLLAEGKTTMVEYGATWCKVCKRLKPKLHAFAESRDDVVLRYVDVTDWPVEKMRRFLPAQPGLPVLDIYGPDGRLIQRTWGEGTFDYPKWVPKAPKAPAAEPAPVLTEPKSAAPKSAAAKPAAAKPAAAPSAPPKSPK